MEISGIYQIQSKIKPERCYIGSAINIKNRWTNHLWNLQENKHGSIKLQRHFNKYGESDLVFIIVELCFPEFMTAREQYYINKLKPWFNISKIADSRLGCKHSEETKRKMSKAAKGRISNRKGVKLSEETKQKLSKANKCPSAEIRKKISEANKGHIVTKETRKKISKGNKGKKLTEEHKRKISEANIRNGNKPPSTKGMKWGKKTGGKHREISIKLGLIPPSRKGVKRTEEEKAITREKIRQKKLTI